MAVGGEEVVGLLLEATDGGGEGRVPEGGGRGGGRGGGECLRASGGADTAFMLLEHEAGVVTVSVSAFVSVSASETTIQGVAGTRAAPRTAAKAGGRATGAGGKSLRWRTRKKRTTDAV